MKVDSQLERLFSSLESSFSAAISRSEEEAAEDLAVSLRQDLPLAHLLARSPVSVRAGAPVIEVGRDFVRTEDQVLYPLRSTVFESQTEGRSPEPTDRHLVDVLRAAARSKADARVEGPFETVTGTVIRCGPDHISIRQNGTEVLIPLEVVWAVRLSLVD
jgi:hypothetical protein